MTKFTRRWRQWWERLAMGSALALTVTVPAVALAGTATDAPNAVPGTYECPKAGGEQQQPEAPGTTPEDARQAAEQDHAQNRYQLGSGQPEQQLPDHPYSQAHYQLGAGHQD